IIETLILRALTGDIDTLSIAEASDVRQPPTGGRVREASRLVRTALHMDSLLVVGTAVLWGLFFELLRLHFDWTVVVMLATTAVGTGVASLNLRRAKSGRDALRITIPAVTVSALARLVLVVGLAI